MQIIKQPGRISMTGNDNSFKIKTDLFSSWFADRIKIDLSQVQLLENALLGFVLDGIYRELVAKNLPYGKNDIQADRQGLSLLENANALAQSLRLSEALCSYKIEVDENTFCIYISSFSEANLVFSIPDEPLYDFTRDVMTFEPGVNLPTQLLDYLLFDAKTQQKIAHLSTAFIKGFAEIDTRSLAETLITKHPPAFTTNIVVEDRTAYVAKYFLRYNEQTSGSFLQRYRQSPVFFMLDGYSRSDKNEGSFVPSAETVSLLQYSQNRVIGRNQADWAVFFFPNARTNMEIYTYQYDKDNTMFLRTLWAEFHPQDMSVKVTGTGTAQYVIEPNCVRYNVSLELKDGGALMGIEYVIDDNNYLSDTRILYWNRKGGFDVLSAKGLEIEEFKTDSDTFVSENAGLSIKTNSKYRTFQFNTGYTMSEEEFVTWADMQGAEIYVVFSGNIRFVKMIVEKLDLALPKKKGELWSVSFSARMAKDDF
jgi:hypothetical protein